ncbi:MAG: 2-oxoisovalerate dehydrogenase subunit beta [Myxococcota bacterium]|nr:2-oxoisovalerate dehydrogenase subunit beta [Myxococcota bacterium]
MPVMTYLEAIKDGIRHEMRRDPNVFVIGEDVGGYGGAFKVTQGLIDEFGEDRVMDTPLAETGFVGAAIGAAYMGFRPVVEMQFIDFIACAFNQITNMAAKSHYRWGQQCPLVIRGPSGGGVSGGPYHSQSPESYFVHTAGLKVVMPATAADAKGLIIASIRDNNPVIYLEHKFLYRRVKDDVPGGEFVVPLGKARLAREGRHISVITWGAMVHTALDAAGQLEKDGVSLEIIDLRSLVPWDKEMVLASVKKTGKVIVLHEAPHTGGFGGEVSSYITEHAFSWLDGPVRRISALDTPAPYSPPLEQAYLPQAHDIVRVSRELAAF